MARKPKAGIGHNGGEPLTDDEIADLQHYYAHKIRVAQKKAGEAKAAYDLERAEVNALFSTVKGDLRYSRKEFEEVLAAQDMTEAEFRYAEQKRAKRFSLHGLPVGAQLELFGGRGDTVDDALEAEANGYRAGLRADDRIPPESVATMFAGDWLRGWDKGQAENGERFLRANGIIEARKAASVELEPEVEAEDDRDPDEVIDDEARALKKSGWTEPTADETDFENAA